MSTPNPSTYLGAAFNDGWRRATHSSRSRQRARKPQRGGDERRQPRHASRRTDRIRDGVRSDSEIDEPARRTSTHTGAGIIAGTARRSRSSARAAIPREDQSHVARRDDCLFMHDQIAPLLGIPTEPAAAPTGCPDVLTLFSQHLENDVSAETCAEMERHIETCWQRCRAVCDSLRRTLALCKRSSPSVEVSAAVCKHR